MFSSFKDYKEASDYLSYLNNHSQNEHDDTVLFSNYEKTSSSDDFTVCVGLLGKTLISARLYFGQLNIILPEYEINNLPYLYCEEESQSN